MARKDLLKRAVEGTNAPTGSKKLGGSKRATSLARKSVVETARSHRFVNTTSLARIMDSTASALSHSPTAIDQSFRQHLNIPHDLYSISETQDWWRLAGASRDERKPLVDGRSGGVLTAT